MPHPQLRTPKTAKEAKQQTPTPRKLQARCLLDFRTDVAHLDFEFTLLVQCLACSVNPAKQLSASFHPKTMCPLRKDTLIPKVDTSPWKDSSGLAGGPSSLGIRTPKQRSRKAGVSFGAQVLG